MCNKMPNVRHLCMCVLQMNCTSFFHSIHTLANSVWLYGSLYLICVTHIGWMNSLANATQTINVKMEIAIESQVLKQIVIIVEIQFSFKKSPSKYCRRLLHHHRRRGHRCCSFFLSSFMSLILPSNFTFDDIDKMMSWLNYQRGRH